MYLLQCCCDGVNWDTFDMSQNADELVARKREVDHQIISGIETRISTEEAK